MTDLHRLGDLVDTAVDELERLWPRLAAALPRDQGTPGGERVTTSVNVHAWPVNADVLAAAQLLRAEVWPAVHRARSFLAEPTSDSSIGYSLQTAGILYRRLVGRRKNGEALRLAGQVLRWHWVVRTAIGLSRHSEPVRGKNGPIYCPLHDDPLTVLMHAGDEGTLAWSPRPGDEAITWKSGEGIYCPHPNCDGRWDKAAYPFLGRLVRTAEKRRRADDR